MIDAHGRDITHADDLGCLDSALSRNNSVGTINQDRTDKREFFDAGGNLLDLFLGVRAWVSCSRRPTKRLMPRLRGLWLPTLPHMAQTGKPARAKPPRF